MAEDTWKHPKQGDLLKQLRAPYSLCIFIETVNPGSHEFDLSLEEPVWSILHPVEGLIQDPAYYYNTLDMEISRIKRTYERSIKKHEILES